MSCVCDDQNTFPLYEELVEGVQTPVFIAISFLEVDSMLIRGDQENELQLENGAPFCNAIGVDHLQHQQSNGRHQEMFSESGDQAQNHDTLMINMCKFSSSSHLFHRFLIASDIEQ